MTRPLTASEQQTLDFLRAYVAVHGWAPSMREIADGCGLRAVSTAHYRLRCLEKAGLIRHQPHSARAIQLLDAVRCPEVIYRLPDGSEYARYECHLGEGSTRESCPVHGKAAS